MTCPKQLIYPLRTHIQLSDHKSFNHLVELGPLHLYCIWSIKSHSSQDSTFKTMKTEGHQDMIMLTFIHSSILPHIFQKKRLFSFNTLVSYDANYMSRALSNGEGIRGSIHILIMNIFRYGTFSLVVQSIHLNSYTIVQFKPNNF